MLLSLILSHVCGPLNADDKCAKCVYKTSDKRQLQISGNKNREKTKTSPAPSAASQRGWLTSPLLVQDSTAVKPRTLVFLLCLSFS